MGAGRVAGVLALWPVLAFFLAGSAFASPAAPAEPDAVFAVVPSLDLESGRAPVAAAEAAGYRVFTWELLVQGPLPEAVLREHLAHPVIRCIPEDRPEYRMGAAELAAWRGFLGAGGRLLLTGNEAARTLTGTDLLKRFLNTKFVQDDAGVDEVHGGAEDPDLGAFGARLVPATAEYGPVRPDLLAPQNQAGVPFVWYRGGGVAAIKAKT